MRIRKGVVTTFPSVSQKTYTLIGGEENYCLKCTGFFVTDDGLVKGVSGTRDSTLSSLPQGVSEAYYSQFNGSMWIYANGVGYIRYNTSNTTFTKINATLTTPLFCVDMYFKDSKATVLFSGKNRILYNGYGLTLASEEHEFYTGIMHCGRLFCRDLNDGFKVWWSSGTAFDWKSGIDGCGYTRLPSDGGAVLRFFNYNEKLVAVRERGITVISAYGEPQHYAVEATASYYVADGIIAETCAICDGKIVFCTSSGIFAFDGNDIERLNNDYERYITAYTSAVAYGSFYYIICTATNIGTGIIFVYDCQRQRGQFISVQPKKLVAGDGVKYFTDAAIYTFSNNSASGSWTSKSLDFGTSKVKLLKSLYVEGDGSITLSVVGGGVKRSFSGTGLKKVNMKGVNFTITITGVCNVKRVEAVVAVKGK